MNKYIVAMLALSAGVAFTSCEDQLDIPQKGVLKTEEFYKNDADCEKALAAAYESFQVNTEGRTTCSGGPGIYTPAKVLANHPGDDVNYGGGNYGDHEFGGSVDEFRYQHTPEAINWHYRGLYLSIHSDNIILDKFKEPATDYQKQAVAEATVLRAYNYFLLACYWGNPPMIDHCIEREDEVTNSTMTQEQYYVWVAEQCENAVANLTERKGPDDKEGAYRVTKGFAYAVAGKARLFAKQYEQAKADFKKVIESGKYELVSGDDFSNLFHVEGDGCPEKIFEVNYKYNSAAGDWSTGKGLGQINHSTWMEANCFNWRAGNFVNNPAAGYTGVDGWGSIGVTEWFGNEFHENDGDSKRFKATLMHIDDAVFQTSGVAGMSYGNVYIEDEDQGKLAEKMQNYINLKDYWVAGQRQVEKEVDGKKKTITLYSYSLNLNAVPTEMLKDSKAVGIADATQGLYGQSFYLPFKMLIRKGDINDGGVHGGNLRLNNIIVMRYAEVLLDYAECCLQTGETDEAKKYINMIQVRAGSKTISDAVDMEVLKREKSYELWFEGCRFQDILRWNDTKGIEHLKQAGSNVPHLFDKLFRAPHPTAWKDKDGKEHAADRDIVWEHGDESNSRFYIAHTSEAKSAGFDVGFKDYNRLFPYPQTEITQTKIQQNPGYE